MSSQDFIRDMVLRSAGRVNSSSGPAFPTSYVVGFFCTSCLSPALARIFWHLALALLARNNVDLTLTQPASQPASQPWACTTSRIWWLQLHTSAWLFWAPRDGLWSAPSPGPPLTPAVRLTGSPRLPFTVSDATPYLALAACAQLPSFLTHETHGLGTEDCLCLVPHPEYEPTASCPRVGAFPAPSTASDASRNRVLQNSVSASWLRGDSSLSSLFLKRSTTPSQSRGRSGETRPATHCYPGTPNSSPVPVLHFSTENY